MMNRFTVYRHTNKINGKVYIGITSKNVEDRWKNAQGYVGRKTTHFYHAIRKYGWDTFEHEILMENLTEKEARKRETELIKEYRSDEPEYGYNMTKGGEHNIPNQEVKDKISKTQKALMTDEKRQLLRERAIENDYRGERNPFYGKNHDEETRKRMSENQWAKKDRERFLATVKPNLNCGGNESRFAKKVVRLIDGKVYQSILDCAEDNHIHVATVTGHCLNRRTYPEYAYFEDYESLTAEQKKSLSNLLMDKKSNPHNYGLNSKAVVYLPDRRVFPSIEACHRETGRDYKMIINHCKGKVCVSTKTSRKFMYYSDYVKQFGKID